MRVRIFRDLCMLLAFVLFLAACAGRPEVATRSEQEQVFWPPAPMGKRIEWVKSIRVLEDSSQKEGLWSRVREFFVGQEVVSMVRPYGVATDYGDRLFIADTGGSQVHVLDMASSEYHAIDESAVPIMAPIGLTYAGNDELFITDSKQGKILRYNVKSGKLRFFTPFDLQRPTGIAFSWRTRQLYVVDTAAHQVVVYALNGTEQFRFGGRGTMEGRFNFPTDIWVDLDGQVYVTDALNARIQIFSAEGDYLQHFGQPGDTPGSFAKPKGVAVDPAGHIYVSDALFDAVQIFDANGNLLMAFGDNGSRAGQFWMPSGIFADRKGYIYVSDTYNQRIQVFRHVNCSMNHDCSK